MKRILICGVVILLAGMVYLNRAYARIYTAIGKGNLANPTAQEVYLVDPPTGPTKKVRTVLFLGDSLTAGVGANAYNKTYPYIFAERLAEKQKQTLRVVNLAVPGATSADVLRKQLPRVSEFTPDQVIILIGVNDTHNFVIPENGFAPNVQQIVDSLIDRSKASVTVLNIPFLGSKRTFLPPYRAYYAWRARQYNRVLETALLDRRAVVVDLYSATYTASMQNSSYYSRDGFHPSEDAYKQWGIFLYDNFNP